MVAAAQGPPQGGQAAAPVTGFVLDAAGAPVVAEVHQGSPTGPVVATTDARGAFSIDAASVSTSLVVVAPGFAPATITVNSNGSGGGPFGGSERRPGACIHCRAGDRHRRPPRTARRRCARGRVTPDRLGPAQRRGARTRRRAASGNAGIHPVSPFFLPHGQSDHAGRDDARPVGVGRVAHAGAGRRRAAERPVRRLGLLGPRAAGGNRTH